VFASEGAAVGWITFCVQNGTVLNADEASSWNDLHGRFEMKRVNHQEAHTLDALAGIGRKTTSPVSVAAGPTITITSQARICFAARKKRLGEMIIAAPRMAIRLATSSTSRCGKACLWISQATGSGM